METKDTNFFEHILCWEKRGRGFMEITRVAADILLIRGILR